MKRWILVLSMICLLGTLASAQITIGVDISATGAGASLGIPNMNAIALAPKMIAGQTVNYVVLDDASDTSTAVQNVKRLISESKIDMLLGPSTTTTTLAVIATVADAKVPIISFASNSSVVLPMDAQKKWIFKTAPNDDIYCLTAIRHMVRTGVKTLSMIAVDDSFGDSWVEVTKKEAGEAGIRILTIERFQRDDPSATAQALRAMRGNPDAILIAAVGTPAATPHLALYARGYKGKIYQSGGATNPEFLRVGKKAVEGAFLPTSPFIVTSQLPDGYPNKAAALEFLKIYEGKYGPGNGSSYAAHGWDGVKLMEAAIPVALRKAKPGTVEFREALRTALENLKGVRAPSAVFSMSPSDHTGIDQWGMVLVKIENSAWKLEEYYKPDRR